MGIDEKERERAILDVTVELLLRHGYNKVTMSDVADAVGSFHPCRSLFSHEGTSR